MGTDNERKKAAMSQPPTIETSAASSYTGTLTFDLVVDILSRLPVKSLVQLKCVCKSWNSLISDPNFAKKHLSWSRTHLNRHHILSLDRDSESVMLLRDTQLSSFFNSSSIPSTRLSFPLIHPHWNIAWLVGSCNGILCFSIRRFPGSFAMVWNPSIRKFKILPPLEYPTRLDFSIYGFGYDCLTDTYKLVAFRCDGYVCQVTVMLHTLGKDTWKTVEGFPSRLQRAIQFSTSGVFVSGTVNWLVGMRMPNDPSSSQVILSLDLGNESFQEFLPPDCGKVYLFKLGVLRDCLCMLAHTVHTDTPVIHAWLMKDYGNEDSWTKLFTFPLMELSGSPFNAYPLYISEDDQLLLDLGDELAVYNSKDGTGKTHEHRSILGSNFFPFENRVYIESLIAPWP